MDRFPLFRCFRVLVAGVVLTLVALALAGVVPATRFRSERIEVSVRPEAIDVNGLYVYANPLPIPWTQGLRIPFAVDDTHPAPATVRVTEVDPESEAELREIPVRWWLGEPHFVIQVSGWGSAYVRVEFTQRCARPSATYLLTTTRAWGAPLEHGEYILRPRGVRVQASNYPLEGPDHLGFVRHRFLPEQEWKFAWIAE